MKPPWKRAEQLRPRRVTPLRYERIQASSGAQFPVVWAEPRASRPPRPGYSKLLRRWVKKLFNSWLDSLSRMPPSTSGR